MEPLSAKLLREMELALHSGDLIELEVAISGAHNEVQRHLERRARESLIGQRHHAHAGSGRTRSESPFGTDAVENLNRLLLRCKKTFIDNLEASKPLLKPLRQACRRRAGPAIFAALDRIRQAYSPTRRYLSTDVRRAQALLAQLDRAAREAALLLDSCASADHIDHFLADFATLLDDEVVLQLARKREEIAYGERTVMKLRSPARAETEVAPFVQLEGADAMGTSRTNHRDSEGTRLKENLVRSAMEHILERESGERWKGYLIERQQRAVLYASQLRAYANLCRTPNDVLHYWGKCERLGVATPTEFGTPRVNCVDMPPSVSAATKPAVDNGDDEDDESFTQYRVAPSSPAGEGQRLAGNEGGGAGMPAGGASTEEFAGDAKAGYQEEPSGFGSDSAQRRTIATFTYGVNHLGRPRVSSFGASPLSPDVLQRILPGNPPSDVFHISYNRQSGDRYRGFSGTQAAARVGSSVAPRYLPNGVEKWCAACLHNLPRDERELRLEIENNEEFYRSVVLQPMAARTALLMRLSAAAASTRRK